MPAQIHPLDDPALVTAFLDQGDAWCMNASSNYLNSPLGPGGGLKYVSISEMTPSHALNTARFVLNKARDIYLCLFAADGGKVTPPVDEGMDDDASCRRALRQTPLVKALLARAAVRSSSMLPWETIGAASFIDAYRLDGLRDRGRTSTAQQYPRYRDTTLRKRDDFETSDGVEEGVVDRDQYARADPLGLGFVEADGDLF